MLLGQFFKQFGAPADERLNDVTVEELLAHRAGLRGNADDDPIFGIFPRRALWRRGLARRGQALLAEYMMKERLARHPGGRYSYSNTGYEILTAIIEEQSGRSYEDYCGEAVFGKLGIAKPKLHPDWQMLSGAGGWFIPGAGLSCVSRHLRSGASVPLRRGQGLDRPGADPMDARPSRPLVQPWHQHLGRAGPLGGVAWRHHERARPRLHRQADQRRSSATRSGPPTARRCSWRCRGRATPRSRSTTCAARSARPTSSSKPGSQIQAGRDPRPAGLTGINSVLCLFSSCLLRGAIRVVPAGRGRNGLPAGPPNHRTPGTPRTPTYGH